MTLSPGELYLAAAEEAAARVIEAYSTSFGLASRLLAPRERRHVRNIYALVRVADEIVDGVGTDLGLSTEAVAERLDEYQREVHRALDTGYSTDLIVHAFAVTARVTGFGRELVDPFFESMRQDTEQTRYDEAGFDRYVYGSAEVVGLMCLAAFLEGRRVSPAQRKRFEDGARALGAAFQKVNFLRDLATDVTTLGRAYFPGVDVTTLDESTKRALLADLDADLAVAAVTMRRLPRGSRRAVTAAHGLFAELSRRIAATPAERLLGERVSVPPLAKARILASAVLAGSRP